MHDWEAAERYFLDKGYKSKVSLREISEKFDIPYQSVRRYAGKCEWHNKRYRAWVKEQEGMSYEEHMKKLHDEAMGRG